MEQDTANHALLNVKNALMELTVLNATLHMFLKMVNAKLNVSQDTLQRMENVLNVKMNTVTLAKLTTQETVLNVMKDTTYLMESVLMIVESRNTQEMMESATTVSQNVQNVKMEKLVKNAQRTST